MKTYDPRPPQTYPYCECGHSWGTHDIFSIKESIKDFFATITHAKNSYAGKCDKCMCPQYKHFGRFSDEKECRKKLENKN